MKRIGVVGAPGNWSSERLADAVAAKTGYRHLVDMGKLSLNLQTGSAICDGLDVSGLDALIIKKAGKEYSPDLLDRLELLRYLAETGMPVYSHPAKIMRLLDRLSCTVALRAGGAPMPPTVITEDMGEALDAVNSFGEAVFKPLYSTKARGMALISAGPNAEQSIGKFRDAGNRVMYIQKKVVTPGWDLGVSFLGGEYLATYTRVGNEASWNTTTANGGKYAAFEPSREILDIAHKAQSLFGLDFTCVDIAETPDGPVVYEVSAFGGFRGLLDGNGIDAAQLYADYVIRKLENGQR